MRRESKVLQIFTESQKKNKTRRNEMYTRTYAVIVAVVVFVIVLYGW